MGTISNFVGFGIIPQAATGTGTKRVHHQGVIQKQEYFIMG